MYSHITLGTNDFARAARFFDAVMPALGIPSLLRTDDPLAFGELAGPKPFILSPFDGGTATPGNDVHAAFLAPSRSAVDAFHATATASGGTDEGAPGLRPQYHPSYHGAYVRDPDGAKLQAVCHRKPAQGS